MSKAWFAMTQELRNARTYRRSAKIDSMPSPYSLDLRWRVVWLYLVHNKKPVEIAQLISISEPTVKRYITLFMSNGRLGEMILLN